MESQFSLLGSNLMSACHLIYSGHGSIRIPNKKIFYIVLVSVIFLTSIPTGYAEKKAILTFDDNWKGQYLYVKPILEKYGFKATFFVVCNWVGPNNTVGLYQGASAMTWKDIKSLQEAGHDIESHGMDHMDLTKLSQRALEYEVGQSKQCLLNHNINSTIFANPFSTGWDNATVTNTVAKYYDLDRAGYGPYTYLKCDGWKDISNQTDCRTYSNNGSLTFGNRYSLRTWNHNGYDRLYEHNATKILPEFIAEIQGQAKYNDNRGVIDAIPILVYHNIDHVKNRADQDYVNGSATDVNLFDAEMKYLHDNDIRVLTMADLAYNKTSNQLYIKSD
jgi:peptidoglycan/xylan/chitin deacetylase (PgdA/CDA1 family)